MTIQISHGYHWTPKENRQDILRGGLQLMKPCRTSNVELAYICFALDPCHAWRLTNPQLQGEIEEWDLWSVEFDDKDHIEFLPDWGASIREVRSMNSIPPDRLWWVGERTLYAHESIYKPEWERYDEESGEVINQKKGNAVCDEG